MIVAIGICCVLMQSVRAEEPTSPASQKFVFRDCGNDAGIFPSLAGTQGHAAAWGDIDGSGWPSLYVGAFHTQGSKPGTLLRNEKGKFKLDEQPVLRTSGFVSGALFIDLTNSGRLDLYVSTCAITDKPPANLPSHLYRNDGQGKFTDISQESGACPPAYEGRGLAAIDFDGDGLLDLLTCERYYGAVETGPMLLRNLGEHRFENVAKSAGLPPALSGLGAAVADVNGDGWPDIFLTAGDGHHRLLLNDGHGKFAEAPGSRDVFRWKCRGENSPAGVCIADVNRDGWPEILIGHHFEEPWRKPEPVRLYLHRGVKNGVPQYENVTEAAGLAPLSLKAPHVEIQDFDNDGWPDLYVSIVKFQNFKPHPLIYRNLGVRGGIPRFREEALAVNDFPTAEDTRLRSDDFFAKMLQDRKITYTAAGPTADFNRDGRLDLFLANWWMEDRSLLLKNETPGGNWLDVQIIGPSGVNRMGIGARVNLYAPRKPGEPPVLLGCREIAAGFGYCSGQEPIAHFGLAQHSAVDVEVLLPHGNAKQLRKNVPANQRLTIKFE